MKIQNILAGLLFGSALSLSMGGLLLYVYRLATPAILSGGWVIAILLVCLGVYVLRLNVLAINISTILGILSIVVSPLIPAHREVLPGFGSTPIITLLDTLQILGFYVFPAIFIVLRFVKLKTNRPNKTKAPVNHTVNKRI
ncbi:MAG: hypothetical protein QXP58_04415 [Thermoprotei archaeon]